MCAFSVNNPDGVCAENRTGILCGECTNGLIPSANFNGKCLRNTCIHHKWWSRILATFAISFAGVLMVMFIEIPLHNGVRSFLYFAFALNIIFPASDSFFGKVVVSDRSGNFKVPRLLRPFHVYYVTSLLTKGSVSLSIVVQERIVMQGAACKKLQTEDKSVPI